MKKRILIVEDYPSIAMDEEYILKQLGYEVVGTSVTGEGAVQRADEEKPDAVLMDIRLIGEMTGVQAAREIRNNYGIPVVFVTAHGDKETSRWTVAPEGYAYVVKPYTRDELAQALAKVLDA